MRIGIVCYPTYGGSGAAATELGLHLARRGHSVHLISGDRPFRAAHLDFTRNFVLHEIPSVKYPVLRSELYTLSTAVCMAQLADEENLDVLHSHYAVPHAVSAVLARRIAKNRRVRLVTTLHGTDITLVGSHPAFAPVVRMGILESDAVIAVSSWLRAEMHRRFDLDNACHVIHNFVDPEEYRPLRRPRCSRRTLAEPGEKIVMHVSNFRPVKRVADVVGVFARIVREVPAVLVMVGDGPDRDQAERMAHELGVHEHVRFLGLQEDVATLLDLADLFLFPSEYESFGLAALEAMACETPVVCSDSGGLPEVVEDGVTGILCPMGDVEAMAQQSIAILRDEKRALAMGHAARLRATTLFGPDQAVRAHEELYESLLAQAPHA